MTAIRSPLRSPLRSAMRSPLVRVTASGQPLVPLLLDTLSSPIAAAISSRKLRNNYTGSAIRVRESINNTELDIGFNELNKLDTVALLAHCGAGSGFIVTWYDQNGNGRHITLSDPTKQPRIVNAGVIDSSMGIPFPNFDSQRRLVYTGYSTSQPFEVVAAISTIAPPAYSILFDGSTTGLGDRALAFLKRGDLSNLPSVYAGANATFGSTLANNTRHVMRWSFNGASSSASLDGTAYTGLNPSSWGIVNGFMVGGVTTSTNTGSQVGELILSAGVLSDTDRQILENSQGEFIGLYRQPAILDSLSVSTSLALSLRALRGGWNFRGIRVRRSSDNAEADIGFTSIGGLDTVALLAHCGSGSGFIVTWYDQSIYGRHATQATAAYQPRIVNAGVVDTANGVPTLIFSASTYLVTDAAFSSMTANFVFRDTNATFDTYSALLCGFTSRTPLIGEARPAGTIGGTSPGVTSAFIDGTAVASLANYNNYLIGIPTAVNVSHTLTHTQTATNQRMVIGSETYSLTTRGWRGPISEVVLFDSELSTTDRQTLERN